jgi:hypothetical protein
MCEVGYDEKMGPRNANHLTNLPHCLAFVTFGLLLVERVY